MKPVRDPGSNKYHDRIFYQGQWLTQEAVEERREKNCERQATPLALMKARRRMALLRRRNREPQ